MAQGGSQADADAAADAAAKTAMHAAQGTDLSKQVVGLDAHIMGTSVKDFTKPRQQALMKAVASAVSVPVSHVTIRDFTEWDNGVVARLSVGGSGEYQVETAALGDSVAALTSLGHLLVMIFFLHTM
jgi:hypothetical protein